MHFCFIHEKVLIFNVSWKVIFPCFQKSLLIAFSLQFLLFPYLLPPLLPIELLPPLLENSCVRPSNHFGNGRCCKKIQFLPIIVDKIFISNLQNQGK